MTLTKNTSKGLKIQSIRQAKLPYKLIALINLLIFDNPFTVHHNFKLNSQPHFLHCISTGWFNGCGVQ